MEAPPHDEAAGLLRNCLDSIAHALSHFSAENYSRDTFHNGKWAFLSVAHAAELYCNLLLIELDPRHPCGGRYPSLAAAISQLQEHPNYCNLSLGERTVVEQLFTLLPRQRHTLMHRPTPTDIISLSDAAIALLALVYLVKRRTGISTRQLFDQDPPAERDVLEEIKVREQLRWFAVIERLVREDYELDCLEHCENCGLLARIPNAECVACFEEAT